MDMQTTLEWAAVAACAKVSGGGSGVPGVRAATRDWLVDGATEMMYAEGGVYSAPLQ
jgi:hypothetical protein